MQNASQKPPSNPSLHRPPPGPQSRNPQVGPKTGSKAGSFQIPPSPISTYWSILRLADALTQDLIDQIRSEVGTAPSDQVVDDSDRRRNMARRIEAELFAGHGNCWLGDEEIARMVQAAIQVDHGRRYTLRAWSILPNHMQVVFAVAPGVDPSAVIRDWKTFTERQANLATGRGDSPFWERSSYIRPCMDDADAIRRIKGVEFRPVNAQLCRRPSDWPWSSAAKSVGSGSENSQTANRPLPPAISASPQPSGSESQGALPSAGNALKPSLPARPTRPL